VKPANILVTPYGRPMLVDFGVSVDVRSIRDLDPFSVGGTIGYMAPEHLEAFIPGGSNGFEAVGTRSDIYALAVVLYELLVGRRPGEVIVPGGGVETLLIATSFARKAGTFHPRSEQADIPEALDRVIARCLEPDPAKRWQTGMEFARALDGCRELLRLEKEMPAAGPVTKAALARPFAVMVALAFLPHMVGSAVNIGYNTLRIVGGLSDHQQSVFANLVLLYNVIVYPACLVTAVWVFVPGMRMWRRLNTGKSATAEEIGSTRARVLTWPLWAIALAVAGWLPGGLFFPMGITARSDAGEAVGGDVYGHFLISHALAGLIATTYSYFAVQYVVLRVLYARLWADARELRPTAARELGAVAGRVRFFQFAAGAIPLAAAALLVGAGAETAADRSFRVLFTVLIGLGAAGFTAALSVGKRLERLPALFAGSAQRA
jgi:hypothetical protein